MRKSLEGPLEPGDQIDSKRFGPGRVEFDKGDTVIARFEHGLEECPKSDLALLLTPLQAAESQQWHPMPETLLRVLAEAIVSVNDSWGVFSPSRIALLPHQLWVCKRVLGSWPFRWLVADDVGLGKTIEAGLILWPLLARGTVDRLLILCPASLVDQWQYRLRTMFDIRTARYVSEADTEKADFWSTHDQVVASLHTLRSGARGRHDRMLASPPWDLLIVDEAHHLNNDEHAGETLGYKLVKRLVEERHVRSMAFFTGTPHRGKNFGFLSLMHLLRPDLFDIKKPFAQQLTHLSQVMIRNNKQNVTDLSGQRLFRPPAVTSDTYSYSAAEDRFYSTLTEFIASGKAYASTLSSNDGRAVMLVLVTMQKLASSSIAAVRRALKRRLARIREKKAALHELSSKREEFYKVVQQHRDFSESGDLDTLNELEEEIAALSAELILMRDEEPRLEDLVAEAEKIKSETKIERIVSLTREQFGQRSILFFTEYKATQSLLMSCLIREYGDDCVTFINGDKRAEEVVDRKGQIKTLYESREAASEKFNSGEARFLVSTEAGGEGIDLQERCYSLVHVDLPWNPMRLHQRVGRLNRYGQSHQVEVLNLRNPATVESRIWEKLNVKLNRIMQAFGQVMDEPEDLLQLVLGMTSSSFFVDLFAEATDVPKEAFSGWFDRKTARFGGADVVDTVQALVGNSAKFDYGEVSPRIPKLDLKDLKPFLLSMLALNRRRSTENENGISFKTPEEWLKEPGVRRTYEGMVFDRMHGGRDAAQRVLGVGHKAIDQALEQARSQEATVAVVPGSSLESPLVVCRITDRITGEDRAVRAVILGVEYKGEEETCRGFLRDWELVSRINGLLDNTRTKRTDATAPSVSPEVVKAAIRQAVSEAEARLSELDTPFKVPYVEAMAVLWPME